MPFLARNPSYYLDALEEVTTDPLHLGIYLDGNATRHDDAVGLGVGQMESASTIIAESSWAELAEAIQETSRTIRCLWIRMGGDRSEDIDRAFRDLARALVGATHIESIVLEDEGIGGSQLECVAEYLARNFTVRGIKLLRTNADSRSSMMLNGFLSGNPALRVLDLTGNPWLRDETIGAMLGAVLQNRRCRLETLNIIEDFESGGGACITESGVGSILSFVSQSKCLRLIRACMCLCSSLIYCFAKPHHCPSCNYNFRTWMTWD